MRKYDNEVQKIKSQVLYEVASSAFKETLLQDIVNIPIKINPGPNSQKRCCIHHERAVTRERIQLTLGGDGDQKHIIEVLDSACDLCSIDRFFVTETCRGCLAVRCLNVCPVNAIEMINSKAFINQKKCVECGKCKDVCPYSAIADMMRPCRRDCPTNSILIDENRKAVIDYDKCISCGACVYNCPFGAIQEKSEIIDVIDDLLHSTNNIYAIIAPSFSAQFNYVNLGQVISGIKKIGFRDVVEVALGADLIIEHEAKELIDFKSKSKTLTSSCCPGFVSYIKYKYPDLEEHISKTVSPMIATARLIKNFDENAIVVFIGPCIAKKSEKLIKDGVDYVLTFEELAAMIAAKDIDLTKEEEIPLNNASYYGRRFAATGGLTMAINKYLENNNIKDVKIETCDGIKECDKALKLLKFNKLNADFIEGMACKGGCIKGPVTMHHGAKDIKAVENYSNKAFEKDSSTATEIFLTADIKLVE